MYVPIKLVYLVALACAQGASGPDETVAVTGHELEAVTVNCGAVPLTGEDGNVTTTAGGWMAVSLCPTGNTTNIVTSFGGGTNTTTGIYRSSTSVHTSALNGAANTVNIGLVTALSGIGVRFL